jgi:hypothetical protein
MVSGLAVWLTLWLGQATSTPAPTPARAASADPTGTADALAEGGYPWYDAKKDELAPVEPPWTPSWWDKLPNWDLRLPNAPRGSLSIGNLFVFLLLVLALAALVAGLVWAYRYYMPDLEDRKPKGRVIGTASLMGGLPPGLPADLTDPLGLARELRARGDFSGAILALFVHQVITLDRLRVARLAPGRTARQLVRSIADTWIRARVEPTLRLFETSFYGHHVPSLDAFEHAWRLAEEFEARIAAGGVTS